MAKPAKKQLEWANLEIGVIIHPLMNIYNPDYDVKSAEHIRKYFPAEKYAPMKLDTDQWLAAAKSAGAKYAVLVANHCSGFSLWQTDANDYSVARSPWKDGKGDIVADFIASCEKYDIRPGLYYSTGTNGYYGITNKSKLRTKEYDDYVKVVEAQLTELWTRYGKLFEIWFDGGIIPKEEGGPDVVSLLEKYQPDAICFQGPKSHAHNVRWVGNELGIAPENCWSSTNLGEADFDGCTENEDCGIGTPDGKYWMPCEDDMSNRRKGSYAGGWAWRAGEEDKVYTPEELFSCYLKSVGHNGNLLLGMVIDTDGLFPDTEQFSRFGELVRENFGRPVAETSGKGTSFTLSAAGKKAKYAVIEEDITEGHIIRGFRLIADGETIYTSECVGHKRIIPLDRAADTYTLEITESTSEPVLRGFKLY